VGSNLVTIANSAPTQPGVNIAPNLPLEQVDDLFCDLTATSTDVDGDDITYDFVWDVGGVTYPAATGDVGPTQAVYIDDTASGADTWDGELWTCTVVAKDTELLGSVAGTDDVTIGSYAFTPDYDGQFDITGQNPIPYTCAFGQVNVSMTTATMALVGAELWVQGGPSIMKQNPYPTTENFIVTDVISAGLLSCDETYTMSGTFSDNDTFTGIYSVSFNGFCAGSGCVNQIWPITGVRI
jgi:hypothetical protein